MNTAKTLTKFWARMGDMYGKRWYAEYGDKPSPAWTEVLNRYTPQQLADGIARLTTASPQHPPTLPQFEQQLTTAIRLGRGNDDPAKLVRDYWRSRVMGEVRAELRRRGLWVDPFTDESQPETRQQLGLVAVELLDSLCTLENATGQRTEGIERSCETRSREIGTWVAGRFAPPTDSGVPF